MEVCILQGQSVTPEMPGNCYKCFMYLSTCSPVIENGYLTGAECDENYCEYCLYYETCGK
jgi:hypothetical protein